jgi:hypothetical protein
MLLLLLLLLLNSFVLSFCSSFFSSSFLFVTGFFRHGVLSIISAKI